MRAQMCRTAFHRQLAVWWVGMRYKKRSKNLIANNKLSHGAEVTTSMAVMNTTSVRNNNHEYEL